jgi:Cfr10I/Bse634I restriction endonuclease
MNYIRKLPNGKSQIMKKEAIISIRNGQLPHSHETYKGVMDQLDKEIMTSDNSINKNALNNAHGDWYEWMLAVEAWNLCATNPKKGLAILLPNISQYDLAKLYKDDLRILIEDLRDKVQIASAVKLISSNPDFVILSRSLMDKVMGSISPISEFSIESLNQLGDAYTKFSRLCNFEDLVGYISVKSSFRPDRRLQIPHEGSLMKAIYVHLQTRKWIINPPGLKYYAISAEVKKSDIQALKTVATHSITTVSSVPQPAVDEVFEINTVQKAHEVFSQIL